MEIIAIAKIFNGFHSKFGVPRQSGLCSAISKIVFEPEYRSAEAVRGLEDFSHVWLIWGFSEGFASETAETKNFSPTVRPPRLGGNRRVGVFATRSPNRPNRLGLSAVKLLKIERDPTLGPVLYVLGADIVSGTPIYDIKPYIRFSDSVPEAASGFADLVSKKRLKADIPEEYKKLLSEEDEKIISELLENDPRPSYQSDDEREYYFEYGDFAVRFAVSGETAYVTGIETKGNDRD